MYNLMLSGIHVNMSRVVFKEKYVNEDPLKSTVHILNMKIYIIVDSLESQFNFQ